MEMTPILGNVPVIRILDFFVGYTKMDHTRSEIKEATEIKQVDLIRDLPNLLAHGVIIETRRIRGEPLYKLNMANPVTQAILAFKHAMAGDVMISKEELRVALRADEQIDECQPEYVQHVLPENDEGELGSCQLEAAQHDFEEPELECIRDEGQKQEPISVEPECIGPTEEL
jgi:hypothetical protein